MNCIIAQSGGPTSVINASVYGLVKANKELKLYDNVYGGLNGIEGILNKTIINLSEMDELQLERFKSSPASGLGSCRYKLKKLEESEEEYLKLLEILNALDIKAFFYVGGNDSMDTTAKLNAYAKAKNVDIKFFGIPKTIDNDLMHTDHTPGFGSAAKFISTSVLETYLDSKVYTNNGIFIVETMGRDTGWLAAAGALATINGEQCADLVYLPEKPFSVTQFLNDVARIFKEKNHVYIVASEGIRDENGKFLTETAASGDSFGHAQLGGVGAYLKNLIIQASITNRVKSLELNTLQRCAMHSASQIDVNEAVMVGQAALEVSVKEEGGYMVAIKRESSLPYKSSTFLVEADKIANNIKYFPTEWINAEGNNITKEGLEYLKPLISDFEDRDSLPLYHSFVL
ncbi:6-phosphofructokinase [Clostridium sp. B9]|uniref:6-phosphofructokinase n=1 Tax=Clostridium sp. B9 TaxID=3423224 RepID=UPI003D2F3ABF